LRTVVLSGGIVGDGVLVGALVGVAVVVDVGVGVRPGDGVGDGVAVGVGVGVGVADDVGVGDGVGVGVAPPEPWVDCTTSCNWLLAASEELKSNPSEPVFSRASVINDPAFAATAEVMSTSLQTALPVPGVKLVIVAPFAGRLLNVIAFSVQLLSATCLMFCELPDPLVANIRKVACEMLAPANGPRSNFMYDSRTGEVSDCKSVVCPKLLSGRSPAT